MLADPLVSGEVVTTLSQALTWGGANLRTLPDLLARVIRENMWQERYVACLQETVTFPTFAAFVTAEVPEGLGATVKQLKDLCRDRTDVLSLIEGARQRRPGARNDLVYNVNKVAEDKRPAGNSQSQALRALRTHDPELHARVLSGELSPHRAMVEAGLRKPTWTAPQQLDDLAKALVRRYGREALLAALDAVALDAVD